MAARGFSQRRACRLVTVDPKTARRPALPDAPALRARLRELAGVRGRFGYRRLGILLEREGIEMNHKRLYRLYREEGLSVRRRRGRKRAIGTRAPVSLPQDPNQRWSLDVVADALNWGRRFRVLAIVDDFTRDTSKPSKPRFRGECLNEEVFPSLAEARCVIEAWRQDYAACRDAPGRRAAAAGKRPPELPTRNQSIGRGWKR